MTPLEETVSPSMVTQFKLVVFDISAATSMFLQINTREKTWLNATLYFSSRVILFNNGNAFLSSGYFTFCICKRFNGKNVTRPPFSLFKCLIISLPMSSLSTTIWNNWFPAAASTAELKRLSHSINSIKGPWTPVIPRSFTILCTAAKPLCKSLAMLYSSCFSYF